MSTKKYYGEERASTSLLMLRIFVRKLQTSLSFVEAARGDHRGDFNDENLEALEVPTMVPDDVKEGHFAVFAVKGSEKKRFVVKLEWLKRPEFIRLLELAEEEYGFDQTGALMIPCCPDELEKILKAGRR